MSPFSAKRNIELMQQNKILLNEVSRLKQKVLFDDYSTYHPKKRHSLSHSAIRKVLDSFYQVNSSSVEKTLLEFCTFKNYFHDIPLYPDGNNLLTPCWINTWLPAGDGISLYAYTALNKPRYYVECGSGASTKFVRKAIEDHKLATKIISIDPYPRAEIDNICDSIYRMPLEDMNIDFFAELSAQDLLFIDNSHRAFQNSDVTVFFTEVMPVLPTGLLFGVHDILLPDDYPEEWKNRFFNEQYLLCCYLLGGSEAFSIELPMSYLANYTKCMHNLNEIWGEHTPMDTVQKYGGAFWMRKK